MIVTIATRMSHIVTRLATEGNAAAHVATEPTKHDAGAELHACGFPFSARGALT